MVTLYHLNHSCEDAVPGSVFSLLPITIMPGSEFADSYEGWRQAFPDGVSVFGIRHITPDQPHGEATEAMRQVEAECERVRLNEFPHKPSRYQAFFALASLEEALRFRNTARVETGLAGSIWEVEAESVRHCGDMRLLTPERCSEANLRAYWEGRPLEGGTPTWECVVVPPVTLVRCIVADQVNGF